MISNTIPFQSDIKDLWVIILVAVVILSAAYIGWVLNQQVNTIGFAGKFP